MAETSQQIFKALIVRGPNELAPDATVETLTLDRLPPGEVVVDVAYSSLNYKDALASMGHPGVVKTFPHVPGIDAAGVVAASDSPHVAAGSSVLVTGYGLGAEVWGGFSQRIRVPADWVVPLPEGVTPRGAMTLGTAGFTAAQSVAALRAHGVTPNHGEVAVTGATGGVGMWSVALLGHLGYQVTAFTGKLQHSDLLRSAGAAQVLGRDELNDTSDRPLLKARWAGAIDTVGGVPLGNLLRSTSHRGCVAACGLVAGEHLPVTVYPFILRGVTLAGIDSAKCPREPRLETWDKLFGPWRVELPEEAITEIGLDEVPIKVAQMLAGQTCGRTLVVP